MSRRNSESRTKRIALSDDICETILNAPKNVSTSAKICITYDLVQKQIILHCGESLSDIFIIIEENQALGFR
jgi:hypothetical protein